ncbi:MAG TPA: response regulator [Pirellulales bacterium]|jgi:FixJ family two-component response regulator|nr:response regulator [Pirellulales bacterium]
MDRQSGTVFVVDDDREVSESLCEIVKATGFSAVACPSAENFLKTYQGDEPGCVILDMQLPGMNGLELQQSLAAHSTRIPVIMLTGHASVPMAVRAVKAGAFAFVEKPHCPRKLQTEVRAAVELDRRQREQAAAHDACIRRLDSLTEREREVLQLLAEFCTPKGIASRLRISLRTVDFHRANLLEKMQMQSVPELIHFYLSLNSRS